MNSANFIPSHLIDKKFKINKNTMKKLIPPYSLETVDNQPYDKTEVHMHETLDSDELIKLYGQFSAEIVHEIRNPLTAIKGFTQILSEDNVTTYREVLLDEIERMERIINNLLVLGKSQQPQELVQINVKEVMSSVILLLNPLASQSNICIIEEYPSDDLFVKGETDKLKQLFINIMKNSIEAMKSGGTITISVKKQKQFLGLTFQDNGVGIPNNQLKKIGEPYFSTKEKGTGIGIMICKKIVQDHGGSIYISSEENKGTAVTIQLPLDY